MPVRAISADDERRTHRYSSQMEALEPMHTRDEYSGNVTESMGDAGTRNCLRFVENNLENSFLVTRPLLAIPSRIRQSSHDDKCPRNLAQHEQNEFFRPVVRNGEAGESSEGLNTQQRVFQQSAQRPGGP